MLLTARLDASAGKTAPVLVLLERPAGGHCTPAWDQTALLSQRISQSLDEPRVAWLDRTGPRAGAAEF